jgi:hypothetical protein
MADEPVVVHGINWKETFPFTLIFRTFRIAIHPSKLILALLALLSIYLGGRLLDAIWPPSYNGVPNEVGLYEQAWLDSGRDPTVAAWFQEDGRRQDFKARRTEARRELVEEYNEELKRIGKPNGGLRDIKYALKQRRNERADTAEKGYAAADKSTPERELAAREMRDTEVRAAYADAYARWNQLKQIEGAGLFELFYGYELGQINAVVRAIRNWNWVGPMGVFDGLRNFFIVGPAWAIIYHPFYFILFGIFFLIVWAIFGGAIARIAAVHVARDEKISIRQALAFSSSKFLSFVSAPIIPLLIILVVGVIIAVGGAIGNIPWIGPPLVGALFFLALAAGFVMTLVLLGLAGGFNLMYPTIAVEGSDSFDAISRSFSYLYARPWRLAFYTLVAVIYGALTYTFVRLFIKLMLFLTHTFVGLFFLTDADNRQDLWPTMWPNPMVTGRLTYDIDFLTLGPAQDIGAGLLSFWVYLTVGMLGAFAISFYFSANTIIYYLMRNEVDATELDDVYLEQSEEEFAEGAAATAGTVTAPAPVAGSDVPASPATEPTSPTPASPPPSTTAPDDESQTPPV